MPLNETHLGLIHLIFPKAPIIHLIRHPLDVVLSVFSNHLTHGFYCAYDLTTHRPPLRTGHGAGRALPAGDAAELHGGCAMRMSSAGHDESVVREMLAFIGVAVTIGGVSIFMKTVAMRAPRVTHR